MWYVIYSNINKYKLNTTSEGDSTTSLDSLFT